MNPNRNDPNPSQSTGDLDQKIAALRAKANKTPADTAELDRLIAERGKTGGTVDTD